jgi:hypothetical protein
MSKIEDRIILKADKENEGLRITGYGCLFPFFLIALVIVLFSLKHFAYLWVAVAFCFISYLVTAETLSGPNCIFNYIDVGRRTIVMQSWGSFPILGFKMFENSREYPITESSVITSLFENANIGYSLVLLANGIPGEDSVKFYTAKDVQPMIEKLRKMLNIQFKESGEFQEDLVGLLDAPYGHCKRCGDPLGPPNSYGNMGSGICYTCWNN